MTIEQFTAALKAEPFRPFMLNSVSGKSYPVSHPEMTLRTPSGRTLVVVTGDESTAILDLLLIESITHQDASEQATTD